MFRPTLLFTFVLLLRFLSCDCAFAQNDAEKITYDDHVKGIFQQRCSSCHSANRKESDLDVMNYTSLMLGGGSGEVISPGSADDSHLYRLVSHQDSPEMPPSGKIPDAEIELIGKWISQGALENAGSKPRKMKPQLDLAQSGDALTRPETVVVPLRIPVEPVVKTSRPAAFSLAASPWANVVALSTPRQVLLYSLDSLELLGVLPFEEGTAHKLAFSRTGNVLLGAGGKDGKFGTTVLWNVATGERITTVGDELDVVLAADISADLQLVAIGGPNKLVKLLSVDDGSVRLEIKKHTEWVTAIEFSPNGKWLATGDRNGAIHVWEIATGAELFALAGHTKSISSLSWRLDSNILASASEDTTVRTWEMEKGGAIKAWGAHGGGVTDLQFMRDGQIATCGRDNTAKIWNQDGGLVRQYPALADVAVSLAYCNDAARMVAADWAGNIVVWGAEGNEIGRLVANPPTLEERLKAANEVLALAINKFTPLEGELQVTAQKLNGLKSSVAMQQQERDEIEAKLNQAKSEQSATQEKLMAVTNQFAAGEKEQQQFQASLPLVETALEKIAAAADAMPDDPDLKQARVQFETKLAAIKTRLVELETQLPQLVNEKTALETELTQKTEIVSKETDTLNSANGKLTEMMIQVAPLEQELAEKNAVAQQVAAEVNSAKQMVAKWQGENEFIRKLESLYGELAAAEKSIGEKQSTEQELQKSLHELEQKLKQAQEQTRLSEEEANTIRKRMLELRGGEKSS